MRKILLLSFLVLFNFIVSLEVFAEAGRLAELAAKAGRTAILAARASASSAAGSARVRLATMKNAGNDAVQCVKGAYRDGTLIDYFKVRCNLKLSEQAHSRVNTFALKMEGISKIALEQTSVGVGPLGRGLLHGGNSAKAGFLQALLTTCGESAEGVTKAGIDIGKMVKSINKTSFKSSFESLKSILKSNPLLSIKNLKEFFKSENLKRGADSIAVFIKEFIIKENLPLLDFKQGLFSTLSKEDRKVIEEIASISRTMCKVAAAAAFVNESARATVESMSGTFNPLRTCTSYIKYLQPKPTESTAPAQPSGIETLPKQEVIPNEEKTLDQLESEIKEKGEPGISRWNNLKMKIENITDLQSVISTDDKPAEPIYLNCNYDFTTIPNIKKLENLYDRNTYPEYGLCKYRVHEFDKLKKEVQDEIRIEHEAHKEFLEKVSEAFESGIESFPCDKSCPGVPAL